MEKKEAAKAEETEVRKEVEPEKVNREVEKEAEETGVAMVAAMAVAKAEEVTE